MNLLYAGNKTKIINKKASEQKQLPRKKTSPFPRLREKFSPASGTQLAPLAGQNFSRAIHRLYPGCRPNTRLACKLSCLSSFENNRKPQELV